jgi:hypothetical protein
MTPLQPIRALVPSDTPIAGRDVVVIRRELKIRPRRAFQRVEAASPFGVLAVFEDVECPTN